MLAQRGAHGLACDIETAAFVAINVAPAARPRRFATSVFAVSDGTSACDDDDAGFALKRAGERDLRVVRDVEPVGFDQFGQTRLCRPARRSCRERRL